jgi:hypothetical protein
LSELTQYLQVFYVANAFCKPVIYQKFWLNRPGFCL